MYHLAHLTKGQGSLLGLHSKLMRDILVQISNELLQASTKYEFLSYKTKDHLSQNTLIVNNFCITFRQCKVYYPKCRGHA